MYAEFRTIYRLVNSSEVLALTISVLAVALVFTGFRGLILHGPMIFFINLLITLPAFTVHELAHRFTARRYGCYARYLIDPFGLMISLITFFLPFRIIALGYVGITCPHVWFYGINLRFIEGRIALSGPLSNIILSIISYALYHVVAPGSLMASILFNSMKLNAWLALFNLLPFPPLDGHKVFRYNPILSLTMIAIAIALFLI